MPSSATMLAFFVALLSTTAFTLGVNAADPLGYHCGNSNFTVGTMYELNLNKLTGLVDYLTQPTGYGQGSIGQVPDQVSGLGSCRGDVSSFDCLTCISEAGVKVRELCLGNKEATVWYDQCMFKYSDYKFFGQVDSTTAIILCNVYNETDNPALFNQVTSELMGELSKAASANSKRYATGEIAVDGNTTIYGMAECTRDLSTNDCKKCLDSEITGHLPKYCGGKKGGHVLGGSCIVRYETYPFLNL